MQAPVLTRLAKRAEMFSALRYRDFRLYWSGLLLSVTGFQILMVAQGWLIYELTDQAKFLGILGLVMAVPTITLNLVGGVVADRLDQRRLTIATQGASAVLVGVLATLTLLDIVQVWHVLVIAFISGAVLAFDNPARMSLYPHLVDRKDLMNAVALNSSVWQGTRIVGPALGGLLIAKFGTASAFYVTSGGFLAMVMVLISIHVPPIPRSRGGNMLQNMGEGLRFVQGNSVFMFLIGLTFFNSFFGMSYVFLLPVFAEDILDVGAQGLGYLHAASGLGALLMTFVAASMAKPDGRAFSSSAVQHCSGCSSFCLPRSPTSPNPMGSPWCCSSYREAAPPCT